MRHLKWPIKTTNGGYEYYVRLKLKHGTSESTPLIDLENNLDDQDDDAWNVD
jgi:hypothetical protein